MNVTLLCCLCLSGNVQKHNHRCPYDQHNNRKKMIEHFLMIMIMSLTMTLFFVEGIQNSLLHNEKHNDAMGSLCLAQLKSRSSTFVMVHFKMAASFREKHASAVELFPLEQRKLIFMFRIMIMLMILTSPVGTKL